MAEDPAVPGFWPKGWLRIGEPLSAPLSGVDPGVNFKLPRAPDIAGVKLVFDDEQKPENITFADNPPPAADELAQQTMVRDIDAVLGRLESGIATERSALQSLLERLTGQAA